jgi:FkbM family methyltransferase
MNVLSQFPRFRRVLKFLYYFLRREPEISYSEISRKLIQECVSKPNPTILEIGCNDGRHTLWILEMFENPTIFCFEPDPRAIARFRKNVGYHPKISLFEIALSDTNGETTFYQSGGQRNEQQTEEMPGGWDLSGSIRKPKDHLIVYPWVIFDKTITVKTTTLDTWCDAHGIENIDFIWMDVQGAEMEVFRGGQSALGKTRLIYTEYSNRELYEGQPTFRQLLRQLKQFKVLVRYPGDVLLSNKRLVFLPSQVLQRTLANSAS